MVKASAAVSEFQKVLQKGYLLWAAEFQSLRGSEFLRDSSGYVGPSYLVGKEFLCFVFSATEYLMSLPGAAMQASNRRI